MTRPARRGGWFWRMFFPLPCAAAHCPDCLFLLLSYCAERGGGIGGVAVGRAFTGV